MRKSREIIIKEIQKENFTPKKNRGHRETLGGGGKANKKKKETEPKSKNHVSSKVEKNGPLYRLIGEKTARKGGSCLRRVALSKTRDQSRKLRKKT